jgi:hypothetical protein
MRQKPRDIAVRWLNPFAARYSIIVFTPGAERRVLPAVGLPLRGC